MNIYVVDVLSVLVNAALKCIWCKLFVDEEKWLRSSLQFRALVLILEYKNPIETFADTSIWTRKPILSL